MPVNAYANQRKGNAKVFLIHAASLGLARPLAVAAHDLDAVCGNGGLVVQLEGDILDQECPDFVAESVGVKVALEEKRRVGKLD